MIIGVIEHRLNNKGYRVVGKRYSVGSSTVRDAYHSNDGSGKTYIRNALCFAALRKLKRVRYIKAITLIETLAQSRFNTDKDTFLDIADLFSKCVLLKNDDFGLMDLDPDKCPVISLK